MELRKFLYSNIHQMYNIYSIKLQIYIFFPTNNNDVQKSRHLPSNHDGKVCVIRTKTDLCRSLIHYKPVCVCACVYCIDCII